MGERDLALGGGTVGFVTVCFKDGGELSSLSESDSDEVDSSELLSTCGCACTGGCFVTRTVAWPVDESESESDDEDEVDEATRLQGPSAEAISKFEDEGEWSRRANWCLVV